MAGKEPDRGPAARAVAENVLRLREAMHLNYTELSERLQDVAGWSINAVGIRRIESGKRRVTPDDLVALAAALGVSPITLLMPSDVRIGDQVPFANYSLAAGWLWSWLRADRPLPSNESAGFYSRALPPWHLAKLRRRWEQSAQEVADELAGFDGDD